METQSKYIAPHIEKIELDNDISLILNSLPPIGPEEYVSQATIPSDPVIFKS